jgi:hypothetical protein
VLDAAGRREIAAIEAAIARRDEVTALEETIDRLRADGDPVRAAARLDDRLALDPGRDADHWSALRDALRAEVRRGWCVTTLDGRGHPSELADLSIDIHPTEDLQLLLSVDADDAAFVVAHDRWVFVRLVRLRDDRASEAR